MYIPRELQKYVQTDITGMNIIVYNNIRYIISEDTIRPGDKYFAERNTGIKLLTCRSVSERGYIIPIESKYPYDTPECIKIIGTLD